MNKAKAVKAVKAAAVIQKVSVKAEGRPRSGTSPKSKIAASMPTYQGNDRGTHRVIPSAHLSSGSAEQFNAHNANVRANGRGLAAAGACRLPGRKILPKVSQL